MFRLQGYRFGIARFLLGLYIGVLINGVVFRHAHRLSDGTIICHAHPYKSSPGTQFPKHAHSRDELIWLDAFDNLLYANSNAFFCAVVLSIALLLGNGPVAFIHFLFSTTHVAFRHRGPPIHLI
ncbi:hypothetical protein [Spirosoma validum]|uniref:Uncharacterized protein n=1 Tax=Spirosoma validum TaxID=2771355 RepID=A0A927AXA8_9BACT|nr:hypothetical protein [Spirosoma validum]MBD2751486.1 hypothetical protein [Spirosoma validum]